MLELLKKNTESLYRVRPLIFTVAHDVHALRTLFPLFHPRSFATSINLIIARQHNDTIIIFIIYYNETYVRTHIHVHTYLYCVHIYYLL